MGSKEEKETVTSMRPCPMDVAAFQADRLARESSEQGMPDLHELLPQSPLARSCAEIVR